jgi:hypothetical protein
VKTLIVTSIAVALAGCATSRPVPLSNGTTGFVVTCRANAATQCDAKAAEACRGPYTHSTPVGRYNVRSLIVIPPAGFVYVNVPMIRTVVTCTNGAPVLPPAPTAPDAAPSSFLGGGK